jgi:hypothetical protein
MLSCAPIDSPPAIDARTIAEPQSERKSQA